MSQAQLVGGRVVLNPPKHTPVTFDTSTRFVSLKTSRDYDLKVRVFGWE